MGTPPTFNQGVGGSIPPRLTISSGHLSLLRVPYRSMSAGSRAGSARRPEVRKALNGTSHMVRAEMCVPFHHSLRLPASGALERIEIDAAHREPAGKRVAADMKTEVRYFGRYKRRPPFAPEGRAIGLPETGRGTSFTDLDPRQRGHYEAHVPLWHASSPPVGPTTGRPPAPALASSLEPLANRLAPRSTFA